MNRMMWLVVVLVAITASTGCGRKTATPSTTAEAPLSGDQVDQLANAVVTSNRDTQARITDLSNHVTMLGARTQSLENAIVAKLDKVDYKIDTYGKESRDEHSKFEKILAAIQNCLGACGPATVKPAPANVATKAKAVVAKARPVARKARPVVAKPLCPPTPSAPAVPAAPAAGPIPPPQPPPNMISNQGWMPDLNFGPGAKTRAQWLKDEDRQKQIEPAAPAPDVPRTVPFEQKKKARCQEPCR